MSFIIETDFPGGNACDIEVETSADTTRVAFAPDPHGGSVNLWFYFRIRRSAVHAPQTMELELKHARNMLGGQRPQNLRPVLRYEQGDWQRLEAPMVEETPDGRLRVRWKIDAPQSSAEVAVCFPYGQPEVETLLHETDGYWQHDVIGVGQRGTPLWRLCNGYGQLESQRRGVYLLARQHAGETPGSWALDGFLRRIRACEEAPLVWVVPLVDGDGVRSGDYGKDQFPYDLNRAWGNPPMRHETQVIRIDLNRWKLRCRPWMALDFHAPGASEAIGIYGFIPTTEKSSEHHPFLQQCMATMQETLTPRFACPAFARVANYRSRWETPNFAQFMAMEYNLPCVSLEFPYSLCGELVLKREDYREAGARIADALIAVQKNER